MTVTRTSAKVAAGRQHEYTLQEITKHLIENLGPKLVAHMVGRDPQAVQRWAKGDQRPQQDDIERRLRAVFSIYELITQNDTRYVARAWFLGMNPQLDDASPAEAVANGDLREAMAAARAFTAGG